MDDRSSPQRRRNMHLCCRCYQCLNELYLLGSLSAGTRQLSNENDGGPSYCQKSSSETSLIQSRSSLSHHFWLSIGSGRSSFSCHEFFSLPRTRGLTIGDFGAIHFSSSFNSEPHTPCEFSNFFIRFFISLAIDHESSWY